ncbi:hypothetical protein ACLOJK_029761 [Asimina triloba]
MRPSPPSLRHTTARKSSPHEARISSASQSPPREPHPRWPHKLPPHACSALSFLRCHLQPIALLAAVRFRPPHVLVLPFHCPSRPAGTCHFHDHPHNSLRLLRPAAAV